MNTRCPNCLAEIDTSDPYSWDAAAQRCERCYVGSGADGYETRASFGALWASTFQDPRDPNIPFYRNPVSGEMGPMAAAAGKPITEVAQLYSIHGGFYA